MDNLDETRQTWTTFFKVKALVDLESSELSFFSVEQTVTRNSESGIFIPSMIPYVREKFRVIVFAYRAKKTITRILEFT